MNDTKQQCSGCRLFLGADGSRCAASGGLDGSACQNFRAGRALTPKFHGRAPQEVKFDPTEPTCWSFWISDRQVMMLAWELDHNQYGHFRCFLIELDDGGVVTKPFAPGAPAPAFAGEVVVKGPRQNDLWRSFDHHDEDQYDVEGNLVNKPREVKIYPARKD